MGFRGGKGVYGAAQMAAHHRHDAGNSSWHDGQASQCLPAEPERPVGAAAVGSPPRTRHTCKHAAPPRHRGAARARVAWVASCWAPGPEGEKGRYPRPSDLVDIAGHATRLCPVSCSEPVKTAASCWSNCCNLLVKPGRCGRGNWIRQTSLSRPSRGAHRPHRASRPPGAALPLCGGGRATRGPRQSL